ncbi:MAG TPA: hypothetical protein VLA34_00240 [Candidatus Krumholzibacterium sp.]|nr:hypothetical protein [Candidatus Krumholzibacterium sp.]
MGGRRKSRAGFTTDTPSANAASELISILSGDGAVDFREEGLHERLRDKGQIKALMSMLARNEIDLLISSMRAFPHPLPEGTELAAVVRRGNPFNCLISREQLILEEQPGDVPVAVSDRSIMGQLLYFRPDLLVVEMDGGFERLHASLEKGEIGGFVAPAADVEAMACQDQVVEVLTSSICMPAAGQGALGIVTRRGDKRTRDMVEAVDHPPSRAEVGLENLFLDQLPGRGKGSAAALGTIDGDEFRISAAVTAADGSEKITAAMHGWVGEEKEMTGRLAAQLIEAGAVALINGM